MDNAMKEFCLQQHYGVAGSFANESKYAYRILTMLTATGRKVYPISPSLKMVAGIPCFKSITDLPNEVTAISFVTPPAVTETLLKQCFDKQIKLVWMQPGAESVDATKFCLSHGITPIENACLLVTFPQLK